MTEGKQCLKCGHTNTNPQLEACPQCGAYYAKVAAHIATNQTTNPASRKKSPLLPRIIKGIKAAKESPRLARIEERKGKDTLVMVYRGNRETAAEAFEREAASLKQEGFEPAEQTWQQDGRGAPIFFGNCLVVLLLLVFFWPIALLMAVVSSLYMLIVKPKSGALTVRYRRIAPPQDPGAA